MRHQKNVAIVRCSSAWQNSLSSLICRLCMIKTEDVGLACFNCVRVCVCVECMPALHCVASTRFVTSSPVDSGSLGSRQMKRLKSLAVVLYRSRVRYTTLIVRQRSGAWTNSDTPLFACFYNNISEHNARWWTLCSWLCDKDMKRGSSSECCTALYIHVCHASTCRWFIVRHCVSLRIVVGRTEQVTLTTLEDTPLSINPCPQISALTSIVCGWSYRVVSHLDIISHNVVHVCTTYCTLLHSFVL